MNTYRFKIWAGPSWVGQMADKCRQAGLSVVTQGTENIYVDAKGQTRDGAAWNILVDLYNTHGTDFGVRPRAY